MVNRTDTYVARELDSLNEPEAQAVLTQISQLLSTRNSQQKDISINDDIILSLSDAYENKRARQVMEWDRLAKQQYFWAA